jgi:uncharacterized membrane protein YkvA (DUF1232 family)
MTAGLGEGWRGRVQQLKAETYALYLAYQDRRVPWYARVWAIIVVGYALSPIDLIPDFIPVLGHVDDLILVPLGIMLALKMIPADVMKESRGRAKALMEQDQSLGKTAMVAVILIWLTLAALGVWVTIRMLGIVG